MQGYLYEEGLFPGYEKLHSLPNLKLGSNHRAFFKNFSGPWSGRLLDVGCGNGKFLMVAKGYGFDVWGIDIDRQSVEIAKRKMSTFGIHRLDWLMVSKRFPWNAKYETVYRWSASFIVI